jgi:hypothetical protein
VHRAIAWPRPPDAALPDGPSRQLLALGDQLHHDLARRTKPPPQHEHALDRMAHLLVRAQHDPAVLIAIEPDRQRQAQFAALGLVAQPAVQPRPDQVQLGLGHRALQPEQQPVVELARRIDAVAVGDQRPGQRAQI